jgi:plastocyanin
MKKLALILALLALAAFGVAACGDDDEEPSGEATTEETTEETTAGGGGGGGGTVSFTANPDGELAYEETEVTAPAGSVTIEFDNPASIDHDVVIEDGGEVARTDVIADDTTSTSAELEPGEYTFYCSVPGHRDAGMEGTLTVE